MHYFNKPSLQFWVLLSLVLCFSAVIHLLNLSYLGKDHPGALRSGVSIRTQDDVSYLVPALNYLDGKGWRTNDAGVQAYFLRPPGYGLLLPWVCGSLVMGAHCIF